MSMSLLYIEDIPFEYKRYNKNKEIPLSDGLKERFNQFYREIKASDSLKIDELIDEWTEMAKRLKDAVEDEVRKNGNKKSIYVEDYVQFIFGVSYLLFDKHHLSQRKVSEILGITPTKYSKLDLFPDRSYQAYTKLDDEPDKKSNKKSLIPDNIDSKGIQIAECINKKIQAVHACHAFVGVSNDLDLFANISTTDKKYFVLTSPLEFDNGDTEIVRRANYAFARYQFALGNQMFNDEDAYVPAGKIKEKIVQMLQMDDFSILPPEEQDELMFRMFLSDLDLKPYLRSGYHYSDFQSVRDEYKLAYENMQIEKEKLESEYESSLIEYYTLDYNPSNPKDNREINREVLTADEVVRKHYNIYKERCKKLGEELLEYIDIPCLLRSGSVQAKDWVEIIRQSIEESTVIKKRKDNDSDAEEILCLDQTYECRLKCAAGYWISEVFAGYDGNEDFYNKVLAYLGRKSPLFDYFDALNAPPSGKNEHASSQVRKNIHIYMRDENMDIASEVGGWNLKPLDESVRPLMVFLDADAVAVSQSDIDKLTAEQKAIVIVHDKSGECRGKMQELNTELNLYARCSEEVK